MKKNHFMRIFIAYAVIMLGGSVLIGLFSIQLFKINFLSSAEAKITSNINLIRNILLEKIDKGESIDYNHLAKKFSEDIGYTVMFIGDDGTVIGQKTEGLNIGQNLINREELLSAKNNKNGYSLQYREDLKTDVLYVANYINTNSFKGYIHISVIMNELRWINRGILSYSLIGVIFVLISSGILTLLFEKDIIDPLKKIIDNSQSFGKGRFDSRVDINSDDTIGVLVREYNDMLDRTHALIKQAAEKDKSIEMGLDNINVGVIITDMNSRVIFTNQYAFDVLESSYNAQSAKGRKIIEVIKQPKVSVIVKKVFETYETYTEEIELNDSVNKIISIHTGMINDAENGDKPNGCFVACFDITHIKKIEQMGADFVSNSTHELKTPLTSIKGFVETLKAGAIEDKEVAYKFLDIIESECERLHALINDILQLSEIQSMKRDVNLGLFYIQDIIPEVTAFLEKQVRKREIGVSIDIQKNLPMIMINKNRIKQALINVIENAIKYTYVGGKVWIKAFERDEKVIIVIKDNGIGIPENALPRLFERFYRVDKGRSRSQGGTGLGLSIVKNIIELYEGNIEVKSELSKGTEFTISLPIKIA